MRESDRLDQDANNMQLPAEQRHKAAKLADKARKRERKADEAARRDAVNNWSKGQKEKKKGKGE